MCPCEGNYVCTFHENEIRDLYAALTVAERRGDDDQRRLRGALAGYGIKAEIVKLRMDTEAHERAEVNR